MPVVMDASISTSPDLLEEGALFARYILGALEASPEVLQRYAAACQALFGGGYRAEDHALVLFSSRHPWSLPFLDAAAGLLEPQSLLRKKLLLMLSILEATPVHVDVFTPQPCPPWRAAARIFLCGVRSALKAIAGAAIYPIARRAR